MLSPLTLARKTIGPILALLTALALTACGSDFLPASGPAYSGKPVPVALLVPSGSGQQSDDLLAASLQNAVELAIGDLQGVTIDLRVYSTKADPTTSAAMAVKAVNDGAQIILGPVYAQDANAAGLALRNRNVNVLSFSNNVDIAGGNVWVLGQTFDNTAARLASYAVSHGVTQIAVLHGQNQSGEIGATAIERAVAAAGGMVAANISYVSSQDAIVKAMPDMVAQIQASGAQAVFLTADNSGALPLVTQLLTDNGIGTPPAGNGTSDTGGTGTGGGGGGVGAILGAITGSATTDGSGGGAGADSGSGTGIRLIGLARWDIPASALVLPGIQGGWFALPDPAIYDQFASRYEASYGEPPLPIASLGYDGIAAIGALARAGKNFSAKSLTQPAGFAGVTGAFRLNADGSNTRALAVATVTDKQVQIIDPAPRSFQGAGF